MKARQLLIAAIVVALMAAPGALNAQTPMGTAFTYQGQLNEAGLPVNDTADLRFTLWDSGQGGAQVGEELLVEHVDVVKGLFTAKLDFGASPFAGDARWLEIAVRVPAGGGSFTTLTPRQELTPAAYALALPGLRTQQNVTSPNLIGGWNGNTIASGAVGATIGGGGTPEDLDGDGSPDPNRVMADYATVGGGAGNVAGGERDVGTGKGSTIGGGVNNKASGAYSTVGGGWNNTASGDYSAVAGGRENKATGWAAAIGGGVYNEAGDQATVGGGNGNKALGEGATVPGGGGNEASADFSFAAGYRAKASGKGSFAWADMSGGDFMATKANAFTIRAAGGVGIGTGNPQYADLHIHNEDAASIKLTNATTGSGYNDGLVIGHGPGSGGLWYSILNREDAALLFGTNNTQRMWILGNGKVGIGRSPTTNRLEVEGNASKTTAGDWLANSDRRIKTDIAPIGNALETLDRVRLVSFRYTDQYRAEHPCIEDQYYMNVIAQEFQEVFPGYVQRSGDTLPNGEPILQVDPYPLTIYSAAAVQELHAIVNEKAAQIAGQKVEISALRARLERLETLVARLAKAESGGAP